MNTLERFMSKIDKTDNGCWNFTGYRNPKGYGLFQEGSKTENTAKTVQAHRYAYRVFKGTIPSGLVIDHLCRNTSCSNPEHLEAVTQSVNCIRAIYTNNRRAGAVFNLKKTHCNKGHVLDYIHPNGMKRGCKTCRHNNMMAHYNKKKLVRLT